MSRDLEADLSFIKYEWSNEEQFAARAIVGWPYAIKRAMEAENEIDRLRNELNIYIEQKGRRCWD